MTQAINIGRKVAEMRGLRNISMSDLAKRSGIKEEVLAAVEKGDDPPTLGTLIRIARALGVRLGTFLDDTEVDAPVVTRTGDRDKGLSVSGKSSDANMHLEFFSLARGKAGRHMEPFIIDIDPTSGSGYSRSNHEGEEFIFVLEGEVEILYGKDLYTLQQGDSIYYDSVIDHHVHSMGNLPAKILAVVYVPA